MKDIVTPKTWASTRLRRVEAMSPGYKVIAGPFNVTTTDIPLRRDEIRQCREAKEGQLAAGVDAKVLLLKDGAWVLRDGRGWKVTESGAQAEGVRSLAKERELAANRDLGVGRIRNTRRAKA